MIENPLEFAGSFGGLPGREVRQSANVDGVQASETSDDADAAKGEIVARGGLQRLVSPLPHHQCSMRTGPEASADT